MGMSNTRAVLHSHKPLFWSIAFSIAFAQLSVPAARIYDSEFRPRPWITADLEILPPDGDEMLIRYDVRAAVPVVGTWTAWLQVNGQQRCFGRDDGSYGPATKRNRIWPLNEWLAMSCQVPKVPFMACVSYIVKTDSGISGSFGPYCSPLYDPRSKK